MCRWFLSIALTIASIVSIYAQELKVKDFHADPTDISAVRFEVKDFNGDICALLKVGLVARDAVFEGSIVKQEYKDGEWWIYMIDGAWWLNIKTNKYLPLRYEFPESLKKKGTYILQIEVPQVAYTGPTGTMLIDCNVRDAEVYVDDEKLSSILPFEYKGPEGIHSVEIKAAGYNPERLDFQIELNRRSKLKVLLKAAGSLSVNGISYEMVNISGGSFMIGSTEKNSKQATMSYETPAHRVTLRSFKIGKTEVTQALWTEIMGSNPSIHQGADLPVENVSWYDVQEFISALNKRTGSHFRLPTEAEWEYAARAGGRTSSEESAGGKTTKVAVTGGMTRPPCSKEPNAYGLYDMTGNVAEWCSDWLSKYTNAPVVNPEGPDKGVQKIIRGGSFQDKEWFLRTSFRGHKKPGDSDRTIGFRLAQDI